MLRFFRDKSKQKYSMIHEDDILEILKKFSVPLSLLKDTEVFKAYLDFLQYIFDHVKNELILNKSIETLYRVASAGFLPDSGYKKLASHKRLIATLLVDMAPELLSSESDEKPVETYFFKKQMLRDALDANHPFGRLFSSNLPVVSFFYDVKWKIKLAFDELEEKDFVKWQDDFLKRGEVFSLFSPLKKDELKTYFYLMDPYEPYPVQNSQNKPEFGV